MSTLNEKQQDLVNRIDCRLCSDNSMCDRVKSDCPKVNFSTLQVDDISILKAGHINGNAREEPPEVICTKTTKKDFENHLYGNIFRCRFKHRVLSFFSSEKEDSGMHLFFFSSRDGYYRIHCDGNLTDEQLDHLIVSVLYPDNKSFSYQGWLCKYDVKCGIFRLYTPSECEQPAAFRNCEMEVNTPLRAIQFINCY